MESKECIMEAKVNSLQRCLDSIYKVIRTANDTLCAISKPSVCSEVLLSPQGIAYISGVAEVYRVAKRVQGGMMSLSISTETLQKSLRDIEIIWNNVQAFISFNPSVLRMMDFNDTEQSILHNGCYYHASCANFWLNCVDSNLPGLIAMKENSEDLNLEELSVRGQNCSDTNPKDFTVPVTQ
ncbi:synergin gamma-like isoform X3 [Stegostoma tigrinum]|uniref:synergin gamma-like isoform X3 n=1 Tax=Stegostoma tigrinum TaxID=3053191 RepID=UPI00202ADC8E|nr:synergin gamma-like isoform X3 [Stegostoma tigrinum]